MRIVVTGGRDYGVNAEERSLIYTIMDGYYSEDLHLAHGYADGVDSVVDLWFRGISKGAIHDRLQRYPAHWNRFGNNAGHERNERMLMLEKPDILIRFPGGVGTADCARIATKMRITIHEYDKQGKGKIITFDDMFAGDIVTIQPGIITVSDV